MNGCGLKKSERIEITVPIVITLISCIKSIFPNGISFTLSLLSGILCVLYLIIKTKNERKKNALVSEIDRLNNEIERLNEENKQLGTVTEIYSGLLTFCDLYLSTVAKSVDKAANGIRNIGVFYCDLFKLDEFVEEICKDCQKYLSNITGIQEDELSVSFSHIYYKEEIAYFYMSGYSRLNNKPSYYRKEKELCGEFCKYYIAQYVIKGIREGRWDIECHLKPEIIKKKFRNHPSHGKSFKYSQYFIYPITGDEDFVGVFQIDLFHLQEIKVEDVQKEIENHMAIFSSLMLLTYKVHKGLTTIPKKPEIKEET